MEENVTDYIQRQLALGKQRLRRYVISSGGRVYPKRYIYVKTEKYLKTFLDGNTDEKRWVIIPGLRGTGKTTILAQTYYDLADTFGDSINLLYFSLNEAVDTIGASLQEVLRAYERLLDQSFEVLDRPTVLLIDEVQSDPKWAPVLKSLNERAVNVFIICSGSSAVHLQDDSDISGRRAVIERLYPMSFCEYEMVNFDNYPIGGLKRSLESATYSSRTARECYELLKGQEVSVDRYWASVDRAHWRQYVGTGSLPFALAERSVADIYDAVLSSVDKVVSKDIQQLGKFDAETIPVIKRLLYVLAESDVMSVQKLKDLLKISAITITNILDVLVQAELLIRVPPQGSQVSIARKPAKYLFMSSVVRAAFYHLAGSSSTTTTREGRLLEDVAGLHYYRMLNGLRQGGLTYDSSESGADFIVKTATEQIAIEVGRGHKDVRQILSTMQRISCKYGIVFSETPLRIDASETVVCIPWKYFALM